jgi:hypothetical protein
MEKLSKSFAIPMLPSASIKETLEFYQAIGAVITYQQKAPNNYVGLKIRDIEIHFFGLKQLKREGNYSTCYLIVDDIDTLYNVCRDGLKSVYGKVPIRGIPRINQVKDIPTYGVRQFIIVDPSGNYIRIGQPIEKTDSVLFEENGEKPAHGTALEKAFELADRLANGKDDWVAAIKIIDKVLSQDHGKEDQKILLFKLITLRLDIANKMEDIGISKQLHQQGERLLDQIQSSGGIEDEVANFNRIAKDIGL